MKVSMRYIERLFQLFWLAYWLWIAVHNFGSLLLSSIVNSCNLFFWSDLLTLVNSPYTDRCVNCAIVCCPAVAAVPHRRKPNARERLYLRNSFKDAHAQPKLFAVRTKFTTLRIYIRVQDSLNRITIPISRDTPILFSFPLDYNGQTIFLYLFIHFHVCIGH